MKWAVISDCTPPNVLGSAVATNAAMEGVFSALVGGPLVGYLSQEMFGYTLPPLGTAVADMDPAVSADRERRRPRPRPGAILH